MSNSTPNLLSELTQEQSKRRTGRLRLQKRDGTEINLFFEAGMLVHAQHGWNFGTPALQEALTWHNYSSSFTEGIPTPLRSLSQADRDTFAEGLPVNQSKFEVPTKQNGFFYAEKHTISNLSEFEIRVLTAANGTSFEELLIQTQLNVTTLNSLIKQLMEKRLLSSEKTPCTPERLKSLRLRKKELKTKGLLGIFSKKSIELTDLEFQVYDVLNGAVTLWDIHLNLGLAREQIWEAYVSLKKRDLVENLG